ncbi:MAG: SRPBCC family protein [Candidatus Binataceae bacterium]
MEKENRIAAESSAPLLVLTRIFDVPRDLVFRAWTDPKQVAQWWGPSGFTNPVCELDVRPGGALRVHMRAPDGTVYPMSGVYQEINPPERLVFSSSALDEEGRPLFEILNTVTFSEQGAGTALRLEARVVKATAQAPQYLDGMDEGWRQSLVRFAEHLARR